MKKLKRKRINKQEFKKTAKKCIICGEANYALLDVHRLIPEEGYVEDNTIPACVLCHRKVHNKIITIDKWYSTTVGKKLRWFDEKGVEHFSSL
jgi:hypothetical protein